MRPCPLVPSLIAIALLATAFSVPVPVHAQSFENSAGLLQGEHLARSSPLYDDTLRAATDTTAWLPFGTHTASLAGERPYAPGVFTAFVRLDTAGVNAAAAPSLTLRAQLALDDTTQPYEHADNTLVLAGATTPISELAVGQVFPVPVYGGGWLRFILAVDDTARVQLDLWRTH